MKIILEAQRLIVREMAQKDYPELAAIRIGMLIRERFINITKAKA